jgi:hypothetical protein
MRVHAILLRTCSLYRVWQAEDVTAGQLCGLWFERRGDDYVSVDDPLPPGAVARLQECGDVYFELTTNAHPLAIP